MCLVRSLPGVTGLLAEACGATGYLEVLHAGPSVAETGPVAFLTGPVDLSDARAMFALCGLWCMPSTWRISRSIGTLRDAQAARLALDSIIPWGFPSTLLLADAERIYLGEPEIGDFSLQRWFQHELGHRGASSPEPFPLPIMG